MSLTDLPTGFLLFLLATLTALSAFFSGSETAMIGLNKYRLRHLVKEKHPGARRANKLLRRPDRLLGVILLGNNLVVFTAASIATVIGLQLMGNTGVVLAPIILTVIFLIFAEVIPKTIAEQTPEKIAFPAAYILQPLLRIIHPGVAAINSISNFIAKPFLPTKDSAIDRDALTVEELRTVVNEGASEVPGQGQNMLLRILDLEKVNVNDILVPRNDLVGINIDDDINNILQILANSQHTRLPVYKDNINNILGILHLRKVARHLPKHDIENELTKTDILELSDEPYFVPEGTPLHTQLYNFKKEKERIALVVDEWGEIQGIVTIEDILEEIVGEFTTDFASTVSGIREEGQGWYLIDGMTLIRDINRELIWDLPNIGPKTLNGLVLEHLETIPEHNVCLRIDDYLIETVHIKDKIIKNIKVYKKPNTTDLTNDD